MQTQRLTFEGATGATLSARLELPVDEHPVAFALFAHCFTCTKQYKAVVNISRALSRERIGVLRFDFTGLGESEGDFADTTFSSNVGDLVAAARYLKREYQAPSILIGHSLGGAAVLQAAHEIPECKAVVTIAAPCEPRQIMRHLKSSLAEIEERGAAEVLLAGRPFTITKKFLDDLNAQNMQKVIRTLKRALLVFHSPNDAIVGIENAARIIETAEHPKSYIELDGADHLLSREEDSRYVGAMVAAWAARYLAGGRIAVEREAPADGVMVRTARSRYHSEILARTHSLVADEPLAAGGTDTGPSPFELLMAALGACTTITLRMYADRKEWPLEEIRVSLGHRKLPPPEHTPGAEGRPREHEIAQDLELVGPLDGEQRARLLEIAHRCPVHRAVDAGLMMPMRLAEQAG